MQKFIRRFIGDKAFYKSVLVILIPLVIQQGITSAVNLLDNLMVGQLGTEQMSKLSYKTISVFITYSKQY